MLSANSVNMRKAISHPFISELKRFVANQNATLGPVVTQISEIIQFNKSFDHDEIEQLQAKQRKLSEVTDMIHAAHIFHRCVRDSNSNPEANLDTQSSGASTNSNSTKRLHRDNILSLLVGDYLLAQSSVDMAELRYPKTVGLIARGLEDYTRGEFLKIQLFDDLQKQLDKSLPLPNVCKNIERYAQLTCGSLLSNACLSAALLAGYPDRTDATNDAQADEKSTRSKISDLVYSFGYYTGTAHRLIEILFCPDTNSQDDRPIIEMLDVRPLERSIREHISKAYDTLHNLPGGETHAQLESKLEEMRSRC